MDEDKRKECLAEIKAETSSLFNFLVATATAFLGGSILFWEKLAPTPTLSIVNYLAFGWLFLIAAIVQVLWARARGVFIAWADLENKPDQSASNRKWAKRSTMLAIYFLAIGLICVSCAAGSALRQKSYAFMLNSLENKSSIAKP